MAQLAPEVISSIGSLPITNTVLNTLLVDTTIIGIAVYFKNHVSKIPRAFQNGVEYVIESLYNLTESVAGKHTDMVFPYFATFFIFIIIANWSGLLPGVGTIGFFEPTKEGVELFPLLRNATSDINVTLALAVISLVITHIYSIRTIGFKEYLKRWFPLSPLIFIGLLELFSEFIKIISLSFRLFGNIYAGEVLLNTASSLFAFGLPVPFMMLEVIVGLVQALVFSMLTLAFMSILMTSHSEESH